MAGGGSKAETKPEDMWNSFEVHGSDAGPGLQCGSGSSPYRNSSCGSHQSEETKCSIAEGSHTARRFSLLHPQVDPCVSLPWDHVSSLHQPGVSVTMKNDTQSHRPRCVGRVGKKTSKGQRNYGTTRLLAFFAVCCPTLSTCAPQMSGLQQSFGNQDQPRQESIVTCKGFPQCQWFSLSTPAPRQTLTEAEGDMDLETLETYVAPETPSTTTTGPALATAEVKMTPTKEVPPNATASSSSSISAAELATRQEQWQTTIQTQLSQSFQAEKLQLQQVLEEQFLALRQAQEMRIHEALEKQSPSRSRMTRTSLTPEELPSGFQSAVAAFDLNPAQTGATAHALPRNHHGYVSNTPRFNTHGVTISAMTFHHMMP